MYSMPKKSEKKMKKKWKKMKKKWKIKKTPKINFQKWPFFWPSKITHTQKIPNIHLYIYPENTKKHTKIENLKKYHFSHSGQNSRFWGSTNQNGPKNREPYIYITQKKTLIFAHPPEYCSQNALKNRHVKL